MGNTVDALVRIAALIVNKNNDAKAHYMYTTKYIAVASKTGTIATNILQPKIQVLTREPHLQNVMNIFVDNGYH